MTRPGLLRTGGLAALAGGILLASDAALHLFVDDTVEPSTLSGLPHEVWHIPGIVALPLVLLGLIATYGYQYDVVGKLGLWGFGLLVVGVTLGAIYSTLFHGVFLPAIEGVQDGLFEELVNSTTAAQFYRGVVVQALGLGLGAILYGVATARSGAFTPVIGWLLVAAAATAMANELFEGAQIASRLLFGVAFASFGIHLLREYPRLVVASV